MLLGLLIIYSIVFLIDLPLLLRAKDKRRLYMTYSLFYGIGFIVSLLQILDKAPITPVTIIRRMVKTVLGVI